MSVNYKLLKIYSKLPNKTEYRAVIVENQKDRIKTNGRQYRTKYVAYECRYSCSRGSLARRNSLQSYVGQQRTPAWDWSLFTIGEGQCVRRPSYASPSATQC